MIAPIRRAAVAEAMTAMTPLYRLVKLTMSRLYSATGAAATQPQVDPDYYYSHAYYCDGGNYRSNRVAAVPAVETESCGPRRGIQWAFIGCPLAKKRVYAETLSKLLDVPYISMASLVRQELNPRSALYKQIAKAVNRGELVPEDIIFGLLSKRFEDGYYRGEIGFILDGIPRSQFQAEILDQLAEIDLVVNFKCNDNYLVKHLKEGPWKDKLKAYFEQSKPVEDYYQKQNRLLDFQVGSAPGETWQGLLTALHLQHMISVLSSKKLTVASSLL